MLNPHPEIHSCIKVDTHEVRLGTFPATRYDDGDLVRTYDTGGVVIALCGEDAVRLEAIGV